MRVATDPVTGISIDSGGQLFAITGYLDSSAKLWFGSNLQQQGTALTPEVDTASTAMFIGGHRLLVVDGHGNGFLWPTSLADWEQRACWVAGRNLTRDEWAQFLPGRTYAPVCP